MNSKWKNQLFGFLRLHQDFTLIYNSCFNFNLFYILCCRRLGRVNMESFAKCYPSRICIFMYYDALCMPRSVLRMRQVDGINSLMTTGELTQVCSMEVQSTSVYITEKRRMENRRKTKISKHMIYVYTGRFNTRIKRIHPHHFIMWTDEEHLVGFDDEMYGFAIYFFGIYVATS